METKETSTSLPRRDFLKMGAQFGLGALLAATVPMVSAKKAYAAIGGGAWRVNFRHLHTGERFSETYRVGDKYLPHVFGRLNYFLRDFRTGSVYPMDPHVLDIVSLIQRRTRTGRPLNIISAYRCAKTNALLRETGGGGVAKKSLHMQGQAIDISMDDYSTRRIRDIAKSLRAGGVGFYPRSDFVHVDTGDVRYW
jgi:uncharacterized protein YcbK (DUF882 family)